MRRFHGNDDGTGIQSQGTGQPRAGDVPTRLRRDGLLIQIGQQRMIFMGEERPLERPPYPEEQRWLRVILDVVQVHEEEEAVRLMHPRDLRRDLLL